MWREDAEVASLDSPAISQANLSESSKGRRRPRRRPRRRKKTQSGYNLGNLGTLPFTGVSFTYCGLSWRSRYVVGVLCGD